MAGMAGDTVHSPRGSFLATVARNGRVCPGHHLLRLAFDSFPPTQPGQFVQLQCRATTPPAPARAVAWPADRPPRLTYPELAGKEPFLRRPLSLAGRRETADGVELEIMYRLAGTGTHWLAGVQAGEELSVLGPLGNSFGIFPDRPAAALIGGGVGIPPLLYLAESLKAVGKDVVAFTGLRSADRLLLTLVPAAKVDPQGLPTFCLAELAALGVPASVSTDDGSLGAKAFASQTFHRWLDRSGLGPADLAVYSCGPEPMMKAVGDLCVARGIACQLAVERHMACGMGACQSCIVKIRDGSEKGWSYKLCCADGPVFDARDVLFS